MPIITALEKYASLSEACQKAIYDRLVAFNAQAGQILLTEGEICDKFWFVESGIIRAYFHRDSDSDVLMPEITTWLGYENRFVTSVGSFLKQTPATETIEVIESGKIWRICYKDLRLLLHDFPELNHHFRMIYEDYLIFYEQQLRILIAKTAEKKYERFLDLYPQLANRLKSRYIASYLDMHPVTLSKERNHTKKKDQH
ncbi:MAG: Crp/Fnr family transcriptional regulator [Spirosomaceae bacterium]|jgi:CRP-like cAMP-binding protein|nr:Crp/Fnr family transcriptional regulator [Spirosomataceae bacterium]